jgi:hypothetical protein
MSYELNNSGQLNNAQISRLKNVRQNQRLYDIKESELLLLELVVNEPTILQCFRIIESTCLSQGIFCKIDNKPASDLFLQHLDDFYISFCRAALRAMFTYGFVPWHVRRLPNGDTIPEVLPPGTFSWYTDVNPTIKQSYTYSYNTTAPKNNNKRTHANMYNHESMFVVYRIIPTAGMFKEQDINVYVFIEPSLDINNNSMLYATVPSPLAHVLFDYKALRQGQMRRSHADAWNSTAKVITEFDPKLRVEDNPTQYLMDFVHEDYYVPPAGGTSMYPPFEAHNVWQREQVIRRQFDANPSTHTPEVFALPRDHKLTQPQTLQPCEDINFLNDKYKRDVCAILGVPFEMISGTDQKRSGLDNSKKTMASGRIFSTNMQDYCKHLQRLLRQVYSVIYRSNNSTFVLVPMPRLEIESIEDLKILHEVGALTPDMSMQLSKTLLGETTMYKKQKKTTSSANVMDGANDNIINNKNNKVDNDNKKNSKDNTEKKNDE